jgi:RNA polymerase sigma-70 factor, ECF subfamily
VYEASARRRGTRSKPVGSDDGRVERAASTAPDTGRQTYGKELGALLESALAALPEGYRAVFMLREVDGVEHRRNRSTASRQRGHCQDTPSSCKGPAPAEAACSHAGEAFGFDGARCDRLIARAMRRLAGLNPDAAIASIDFLHPLRSKREQCAG